MVFSNICKTTRSWKIVSFHQDNPYWQLTTEKVITVWIALTNSDKNSGALEVVPRSSQLGIIKKLDVPNARDAYVKVLKQQMKMICSHTNKIWKNF